MAKCGFWGLCARSGVSVEISSGCCVWKYEPKLVGDGSGTYLTMLCALPLRKLKYLLQERLRARSSASAPLSFTQLDSVYEQL